MSNSLRGRKDNANVLLSAVAVRGGGAQQPLPPPHSLPIDVGWTGRVRRLGCLFHDFAFALCFCVRGLVIALVGAPALGLLG